MQVIAKRKLLKNKFALQFIYEDFSFHYFILIIQDNANSPP